MAVAPVLEGGDAREGRSRGAPRALLNSAEPEKESGADEAVIGPADAIICRQSRETILMHVNNIGLKDSPWSHVRRWFFTWIHGLDDDAFAEIDSFALVVGWEIRRPRLFVRDYRDRRFDDFAMHPACDGSGEAVPTKPGKGAPDPCPGCQGFGRVEKVAAQGGRR